MISIYNQNYTATVLSYTASYANTTDVTPYEKPFSDSDIVIVAVILLTLLVLSLFGNIVTIVVIAIDKSLGSRFDILITSLCVSDLYSAIISPLNLHRQTWGFDNWLIPAFFCKFYWSSDLFTCYVTAVHITAFASMRLASIKWPHKFAHVTRKHIKISVLFMWVICFLGGFVPFFVFMNAGKRNRFGTHPSSRWPSCTCDYNWTKQCKLYTEIIYPIFFYIPIIIIVLTSILLVHELKQRAKNFSDKISQAGISQKKEKQIVLQLFLIVASFLVGYISFTAYGYYSQHHTLTGNAAIRANWIFGAVYYILLRFSETVNPLFYNLGSTKLRKATIRFFRGCCLKNASRSMSSNQRVPRRSTTELQTSRDLGNDNPVILDEQEL
ncbi:growth hormone secretagogue receptor type 1-like [Clavelina lepadiformis]|uniref:G-protein coupled receptors family 1 profile domain-containing protein n=1 Tax=Clavelina lepadiformis TaxID=159417 RepID=A0ABP0FXQ9_CLALP